MKFTLCWAASLIAAVPAFADTSQLPNLSPDAEAAQPECRMIEGSSESCARALACIGEEGLYFDGQVIGWNLGRIAGRLSDGTRCTGTWVSNRETGGVAQAICVDGTEMDVLYTRIDGRTGTAIGTGTDNRNRRIEAWSGELVLEYLTPKGKVGAELPCGPEAIPIS